MSQTEDKEDVVVEMAIVTTNDEVKTAVPKDTILLSMAVKKMYDDMVRMGKGDDVRLEFPLTSIDSVQLQKVVEWLERHKEKPEYNFQVDEITGERNWAELSNEDKELLDPMDLSEYASLLQAAHYLEVDSLRYAVAQTIAFKIKDKPIEEVRDYFDEPDDLSEVEKERIRGENVWANY